MIKKYGENPKQFKCLDDNILFYTNYENCRSFPSYKSKCPICKNQICSNSKTDFPIDYVICCLKRKIYKLLFYDGLQYIKKADDVDVKNIFNDSMFFIYFFPFVNTFCFNIKIYEFLYSCLSTKNSKNNENLDLECNIEYLAKNEFLNTFNDMTTFFIFFKYNHLLFYL